MLGKMARSAAHPPFRAVHVAAAVRATRLPRQNAGKARKFALVRRFIWGIPVKGKDNGADREAAVRVFVMGVNRWRDAADWPIPGTRFTKYYLHSLGEANTRFGNGPA
jgi:predicted acyl esterase